LNLLQGACNAHLALFPAGNNRSVIAFEARYTVTVTILALDIGRVRTGVAVSDSSERIAWPLRVISTDGLLKEAQEFIRILHDYESVSLLVGLPISMDGQERTQAAWVREVAESLAERFKLPLVYHDERKSTVQAESMMREMGYNFKTMRSRIDMVAAGVFLQSYLDSLREEDS
jgi:putative Holliday junction resolvase